MLRLLDKIMILISGILMLGLTGAYVSSYIDPSSFVFPSLLSLAYPYLLIANMLLLVFWIFRWHIMAWVVGGIILLGIPAFTTYYGVSGSGDKNRKHDLAILSYNVRYFDFYNWSNQKDTKEKLYKYLNEFPGDIICLQEFSMKKNDQEERNISCRLKSYPYQYIREDMAILSRLPILGKGYLSFEEGHTANCLYCDIVLPNDTIRLYNVHLESYRLGKKERQFMKEVSEDIGKANLSDGARNLTKRLIFANKNRAKQADKIQKHIEKTIYHVVLCGDFNDTPLSYTYRKMKTGLVDSFIEEGRGLGNTYIGDFPSFRIDYILHSVNFETVDYLRDTIQFSDHYPIYSKLKIKI